MLPANPPLIQSTAAVTHTRPHRNKASTANVRGNAVTVAAQAAHAADHAPWSHHIALCRCVSVGFGLFFSSERAGQHLPKFGPKLPNYFSPPPLPRTDSTRVSFMSVHAVIKVMLGPHGHLSTEAKGTSSSSSSMRCEHSRGCTWQPATSTHGRRRWAQIADVHHNNKLAYVHHVWYKSPACTTEPMPTCTELTPACGWKGKSSGEQSIAGGCWHSLQSSQVVGAMLPASQCGAVRSACMVTLCSPAP